MTEISYLSYPMSDKQNGVLYLEWSTEPPTQEGWYWAKLKKSGERRIYQIFVDNGNVYIESDHGEQPDMISNWIGPLPVPELPEKDG